VRGEVGGCPQQQARSAFKEERRRGQPPDVLVTTPTSCATAAVAAVDHGRSRWDTSLTYASPPHMMT
jgi:hypothetical protein